MLAQKTHYLPIATLLAAAANVFLNLWLVPYFGILAAAYNTAIGYLLLMCIVWFISNRVYRVEYEAKRIFRVLFLAIGIYVLGSLIAFDSVYLAIAVKVVLLASLPLLLWLLRMLHPDEIAGLLRVWRGMSRRIRSVRAR
jgi:O-antigen/teichoic acid export membrane protein